jgi:YHS domain-containing protein
MKNVFYKTLAVALMVNIISGCSASKAATSSNDELETDLVCNMKVKKFDTFTFVYKDKTYYFDSHECREAFKMNPDKFVKK